MSITLLSLGFHIVIPAGVFKYHSGVSFEAGSTGGKMLCARNVLGGKLSAIQIQIGAYLSPTPNALPGLSVSLALGGIRLNAISGTARQVLHTFCRHFAGRRGIQLYEKQPQGGMGFPRKATAEYGELS